jgi:hypothetical protein
MTGRFNSPMVLRLWMGVDILVVSRSENIDQDLTKMILERCKHLAPELLVDGKFEVIQAQIGRRPARKGGIRIEIERLDVDGKELIVCHHYGHGGTGYTFIVHHFTSPLTFTASRTR